MFYSKKKVSIVNYLSILMMILSAVVVLLCSKILLDSDWHVVFSLNSQLNEVKSNKMKLVELHQSKENIKIVEELITSIEATHYAIEILSKIRWFGILFLIVGCSIIYLMYSINKGQWQMYNKMLFYMNVLVNLFLVGGIFWLFSCNNNSLDDVIFNTNFSMEQKTDFYQVLSNSDKLSNLLEYRLLSENVLVNMVVAINMFFIIHFIVNISNLIYGVRYKIRL